MGEEVVGLEDDAHLATYLVGVDPRVADVAPVQPDRAVVDGLQQVDAAQQRGLARSGGTDQADHLSLLHLEIDAREDVVRTEVLANPLQAQHRHHPPPCSRRIWRSASQSANLASGMVSSDEEAGGRDVRREVEVSARVDLSPPKDLDQSDRRHQGGVLLQRDEVVEQRRHHPTQRLREYDMSQRLGIGEAQRTRCGPLARMNRLDARPG